MGKTIGQLLDDIKDMTLREFTEAVNLKEKEFSLLQTQFRKLRAKFEAASSELLAYKGLLRARRAVHTGCDVVIGQAGDTNEYQSDTLTTACEKVLRRNEGQLHVDAIVDQLRAGSFPFKAKNPFRSVEVVLQRERAIFDRVMPHVFKLKEEDRETITD